MTTINDDNYELWLLAYAEGRLTDAERSAVDTWLSTHPDAAAELDLFVEAPTLVADTTTHYDGPSLRRGNMFLPPLWRYAAAAIVVLALMIPVLWQTNPIADDVDPRLTASMSVNPQPSPTAISQWPQHVQLSDTQSAAVSKSTNLSLPPLADLPVASISSPLSDADNPTIAAPVIDCVPIYVDDLLVFDDAIYSDDLLTFESSTPDRIDSLLFSYGNKATSDLERSMLGRAILRRLPTADQFRRSVVDPMLAFAERYPSISSRFSSGYSR